MPRHSAPPEPTDVDWNQLTGIASSLPEQLATAYAHERQQVHTLHAGQQEETVDRLISILVTMWASLASYYPPGHFEGKDPEIFFRDYLADRQTWRFHLVFQGLSDPLLSLEIKRAVLTDAEDAVADTVAAIFRGDDRAMVNSWIDQWNDAKAVREKPPQ
ncbi:hypothetical protein [Microvirga sp. M2]|uniref:hypothetical protein n=1 Tax=Microvirga sp. M2 TaxID=3073270 RepID=UPI0039C44EBA